MHRIFNHILSFIKPVKIINNAIDAELLIRSKWNAQKDNKVEKIWVILLGQYNNLLNHKIVFTGNKHNVYIDQYDLLNHLIKYDTQKVILAHNHPSNNTYPSHLDQWAFKKLETTLASFEIKLMDSLILGKQSCYSMSLKKTITD